LGQDLRFSDNSARVKNRQQLIPLLQSKFDALPSTTWLAQLANAEIPAAAIQTVGEALSDPQCIARNMIVELDHPLLHTVRSIANPVHFQQQTVQYRLPPPRLGEHGSAILRDWGFSEAEIADYRARPTNKPI